MHTTQQDIDFLGAVTPRSEGSHNALVSILNGYVQHHWGPFTPASIDNLKSSSPPATQQYFALASYSATARKAENALQAKAFWVDLDAGAAKVAKHGDKVYPTQGAAIIDLYAFCNRSGVSEPSYLLSSGAGIHAYWALAEAIPAAHWQPVARHFKAVMDEFDVRQDPARTADIASILRLPGTLNMNMESVVTEDDDPEFDRIVKVIGGSRALLSIDEFSAALQATGVTPPQERAPIALDRVIPVSMFKNIAVKSGTGGGCHQLQAIAECGGKVEEPLWRAALSVVQSCNDSPEDKDTAMRMLSDLHPGFSIEETIQKANTTRGAMSCVQFENLNPDGCRTCAYRNTDITSPRQLGYSEEPTRKENMIALKSGNAARVNTLGLPVMALSSIPSGTQDVSVKPLASSGDHRRAHFRDNAQNVMFTSSLSGDEYRVGRWMPDRQGGVTLAPGKHALVGVTRIQRIAPKPRKPGEATGPDDDVPQLKTTVITSTTVYMRERIGRDNGGSSKERYVMIVENPHDKMKEVEITAAQLVAAPVDFSKWLADHGVMTEDASSQPDLNRYMRAWRNHLAEAGSMTNIRIPAGWDDDTIMLGGFSYSPRGADRIPNTPTSDLFACDVVAGRSVSGWVDTTAKMYPNSTPDIQGHQFMVLSQLASPLYSRCVSGEEVGGLIHFHSTGSGTGKSSAVRRACSALTNPDKLRADPGTSLTTLSVQMSNLNSFALYVDEATTMAADKIAKFVFQSTAGSQKARSVSTGGELQSTELSTWKSFCITTANKSMLETLRNNPEISGTDGTTARILELEAPSVRFDPGLAGMSDTDAGALAEPWLLALARNKTLEQDFRAFKVAFINEAGLTTKDRFRANMAASVLYAGELAVQMGLVMFDMAAIRAWVIGSLKGAMAEAAASVLRPEQVIGEYITGHIGNTITSQNDKLFDTDLPNSTTLARVIEADNSILITRSHFNKWCSVNGHDLKAIKKALGPRMRDTTARLLKGHPSSGSVPPAHVYKITGVTDTVPQP